MSMLLASGLRCVFAATAWTRSSIPQLTSRSIHKLSNSHGTSLLFPQRSSSALWRRASTTASNVHGEASPDPAEELLKLLQAQAPAFPVCASKLTFLRTPNQFFQTLLDGIQNAEQRVVLGSLYIGTAGGPEHELVQTLAAAVRTRPQLEVLVVIDALRGTRPSKDPNGLPTNSAKTLAQAVLGTSSASVHVGLFHTPALRGLLKRALPARWNETVGVMHQKVYIFDNSMVISGANLSNPYFLERQDRYLMVEDQPEVVDFFAKLVGCVADSSYVLQPDATLQLPPSGVDPVGSPAECARILNSSVNKLMNIVQGLTTELANDTWLVPTVQMGVVGLRQDEECIMRIVGYASREGSLGLASAYFNLTPSLETRLAKSLAQVDLLTAAPSAHGWHGASGVARLIPALYNFLEARLLKRLSAQGGTEPNARVALFEYARSGWQFHAKGIWYTPPKQKQACLSAIGSSNYGYRSFNRDLEAQLYLVTSNTKMKQEIQNDWENLKQHSHKVTLKDFGTPGRRSTFKDAVLALLIHRFL